MSWQIENGGNFAKNHKAFELAKRGCTQIQVIRDGDDLVGKTISNVLEKFPEVEPLELECVILQAEVAAIAAQLAMKLNGETEIIEIYTCVVDEEAHRILVGYLVLTHSELEALDSIRNLFK